MSSSRRSRSRQFKRFLANAFVALLSVVTLLLLVGLFLPRRYRVERSIEVQPAAAAAVFADLNALPRWPEWTPWNREMDPTIAFTFESPDTGAGAAYSWTGTKVGRGRMKLTRAEPAKGVWYDLDFENGKYLSTGSITLEPAGERVRVVWVNEGELGRNPVNRYVGLMMDGMLGGDFEKGLATLKVRAEAAAIGR